jgi:dienelactone hydrolase
MLLTSDSSRLLFSAIPNGLACGPIRSFVNRESESRAWNLIYQLERVVADVTPGKKIGFMGFSMGGKILVEFLERRPELLGRTAGLVLIDPTLPNRLSVGNLRRLLDNDTLLIASQSEDQSPGEIASVLLNIPKISFLGIHGEMPNKALELIIEFYQQRTQ